MPTLVQLFYFSFHDKLKIDRSDGVCVGSNEEIYIFKSLGAVVVSTIIRFALKQLSVHG